MSTDKNQEMTDQEIIEKGIGALRKALGYKGLLRFMSQMEQGRDYLKIQEKLFENMSVDEIYNAARDSLES